MRFLCVFYPGGWAGDLACIPRDRFGGAASQPMHRNQGAGPWPPLRVPSADGAADFELGDAARLLREAGYAEQAARVEREIVGRNVINRHHSFGRGTWRLG